jgi:hypothetical protein
LPHITIGEVNPGLLKGFLYLEYGGKITFYNSFVLFDPLKGRKTYTGRASKFPLAPPK